MYISIDLGGTNSRVASSEDLTNIHNAVKFATAKNAGEQRSLITNAIKLVADGQDIEAISLGVPGIIDFVNKRFKRLPNVPYLNDQPFNYLIEPPYSEARLLVANDSALAGLAEALGGAGAPYNIVAYLSIGTGVGGIRIHNQNLDALYSVWEPGHQIIIENGKEHSSCGQYGCLESYISGIAFEHIFKVKPEDCTDKSIWDEYAHHLATGLVNITAMWNPGVIVLGGSVSTKYEYFYPKLRELLSRQDFFPLPDIKLSKFKDESGLIGGFTLIEKTQTNSIH